MLELEVQTKRGKLDAMVARVTSVLDSIDMEVAPRPDAIIDRCKTAWENFKSFNRDATVSVVTHALAVV